MDVSDVKWRALELAKGLKVNPKNIERVGQQVGAELARWAFTQADLRDRAKPKFSRAAEMLFDRDGLEMASHEDLASGVHRLGFPRGSRVADLTTGIGSDLIGLSDGREAIGFETDPDRAELARHNLSVYRRTGEVRVQDCLEAKWDFDYAFADPARRSGGRRTLDPAQFSPRLDVLVRRMQGLKLGRLKLSPMLADDFLQGLSPHTVFVSHEGECKEALVHVGSDCECSPNTTGIWSLNVEKDEWLPGEVPLAEIVDEPLNYVFEADPAVIRSHGLGNFKIAGLGESNGYLTDNEPRAGWRKAFRTLWAGPFHPKDVSVALQKTSTRIDVVKCRGVDVDVQLVRRQFHSEKGRPGVLILYPVGRSMRAVLCE